MHAFFSEAVTEPAALRELIAYYADEGGQAIKAACRVFRTEGYRRVAFAGMGSSYSAPFAILDALIASGVPTIVATAHRMAQAPAALAAADTLVVATSKSGTTKEVLDLIDGMDSHAGLIALTNQPESTLGKRAAILLPMHAGSETQIASKSFLCTMALLNLLAAELIGQPQSELLEQLRGVAQWASGYLDRVAQNNAPLLAAIEGCNHVDILARGASFSTAYKSALVLREVPRVMAAAIDSADYAHGWVKAARNGYVGIVLAPDYHEKSAEARAVAQILDRGARAILLTGNPVPQQERLTVLRHPRVPESLAPLVQAVVCDAMIGGMTNGSAGT